MGLSEDLTDFLEAFNRAGVRSLIVGGQATIFHGYARSTVDVDIWAERTQANYARIVEAFRIFGMHVFDMTEEAFLRRDDIDVFTFGRPPSCIDLMNRVKGLEFEKAWANSVAGDLSGVNVRFLSREDLREAKRQAGRHRDLDDLEHL